ncbi:flagellar biosynthesis anti-sigma factor FlgM [Thioclava sp. BHET1]|nr:flagellar biosynthesis anti-sigma factor FlgM [Thioclava sp. BHET1]
MVKISGPLETPIPVDQTVRSAAPERRAAAPEGEVSMPAQDVVSLSARTTSAAALLKGVASAGQGATDPEVQALKRAVADGSYRPSAHKIAQAMISHERLIARKLGQD